MDYSKTCEEETFMPKILTFACNWCSYAGADLAGVSRYQYPPSIRIVRVMCSGRVHPDLVLEGFARGADGVLVTGCHIGDCHYIKGNAYTKSRMALMPNLLEAIGIDPRRFKLEWISASEGKKFSDLVKSFTEQVKELGPLGITLQV
ncbi:MAG TPA: hydrogenase iron-sulfur subunit [Candidatus Lokiarchaeia archaeon]|nr:hydrogenase iron-sulfur subunit [Candidatus Lokiarchaeia archaeon]